MESRHLSKVGLVTLSAMLSDGQIVVTDAENVAHTLTAAQWASCRRVRPSWDAYFMSLANLVATRATCDRKHVGAVIVLERRVLATGYNGSAPGEDHCDDVGHDMVDGHCVRTLHAEANALMQAAASGVSVRGATVFVNATPCWPCAKLMLAAGIREVHVDQVYREDDRVRAAFIRAGVRMTYGG